MIKELLNGDKIKINWNKNPIKMDLFLSFLTVELARSYEHLGIDTRWTRLVNDNLKLIISGGIVGDTEYLDSIQYGEKLANQFNNYVNPFYLFEIFNKEGKAFFLDYYKEEIDNILFKQENKIVRLENALPIERNILKELKSEIEYLQL